VNKIRKTWRNHRLVSTFVLFAIIASLTLGIQSIRTVYAGSHEPFPPVIDLPSGFFPEGIAIGKGSSFYVGSLADGSIYKGDLRTGEGAVLTAPSGGFTTVGIEVDSKERIWVAGGPSGTGRVYDGITGELLASYTFTDPFMSFLNDVVVTNDAAYFTDSGTANDPDPAMFRFAGEPRLFVVPLGEGMALPDQSGVSTLPTDLPDIDFPNLNGIETTPGEGKLVVGHTSAQALFTVDPATGHGEMIDIGVPLLGNDGLIRRGTTIYVVENAARRITAVKIAPDGSSGNVINEYLDVGVDTPTTAGLFGNALYVTDARFNTMTDPYNVFRIDLH
jgi:sugar lactone lactonase YvrE